jgi:ribosomal protein S18 acetylase RimI-like enzyme
MGKEIEIVQIRKEHIASFYACLDNVARERIYLGRLQAPPLEDVRAFVLKKIAKDIPHFVAVLDDIVIGWCDIYPLTKETFQHVGVLGMGVHKNYRGQGLGRKLMKKTLAKAREKGFERIELEVYTTNTAAIRLYENFGFEVEGRKRKVRKLDGEYHDNLMMALLF